MAISLKIDMFNRFDLRVFDSFDVFDRYNFFAKTVLYVALYLCIEFAASYYYYPVNVPPSLLRKR